MFDNDTKLFNSSLKLEYIESLNKNVQKVQLNRFKILSTIIEKEFNKDLYELSKHEIMKGLDNMEYMSFQMIRADVSIISSYVDFVKRSGLPVNEDIKKIYPSNMYDINIAKSAFNSVFSNPEELVNYLISISSNGTKVDDGMLAPVCCLLWEGLDLNEIVSLKVVDIDYDNKLILNKYKLTDNFVKILKHYQNTDEYTIYSATEYNVIKLDRGDGGFYLQIARAINSNQSYDLSTRQLQNLLYASSKKKSNKSANFKRLCAKDINLSGSLYRLSIIEKDRKIDNKDIITEFKINKGDDTTLTYNHKIYISDYYHLYQLYKKMYL